MVAVAGPAFGHHFSLRAVAGDAAANARHEYIARQATLCRLVAKVAIEGLERARVDLMFCVIELRLRHPAIDENRFGDGGRLVGPGLHFVAKGAAIK